MVRVLAFGAFDPLNPGQIDFLRQAKALGDHLTVVVAHDSAIRANKGRDPKKSQDGRVESVRELNIADEVIAGRETANRYHILSELHFDIIAMGHDQKPSNDEILEALHKIGKYQAAIVRCDPFQPENYPSN